MAREYELKYRADQKALAAIANKYEGFMPITMNTTYYDTPAGDLSRRRWTLRRRLENGTSVCAVKVPQSDGSRGEWELEAQDLKTALPELVGMGAPEALLTLAEGGLKEVCAARFLRRAATLHLSGCILELALDQGVLLGGGQEEELCEVEVELKDGSEIVTVAFAEGLCKEFGLTPEPRSKLARAMALAQGANAEA